MADKLHIGVIGCGNRGSYFCNLYGKDTRCKLVAICDISAKRLKIIKEQWGSSIKMFTDINKMLEMKNLNAVIVATDDPHHKEPTIAALKAGKHVLLEKPLAQTVEDCQEIVKEAKKAKGIFMIGFELRHCILFEKMRQLIDSQIIGRPIIGHSIDNVSVGGNYYFHGKTRKKEYIKSLLIQKACHSLDLLNWLMGGRPTTVYAVGGLDYYGKDKPENKHCSDCSKRKSCPFFIDQRKFIMDYGVEIETDDICVFAQGATVFDNSQLLITYDNGTRATFIECHFTPDYSREFTIIGDKGKMFGFYNNEGNFSIRIQCRFTNHINEYKPVSTGGSHGGGDLRLKEEFIDCCKKSRKSWHSLQAAYDSTVLAICAEESIEQAKPVAIPLI